MTAAFLFDFVTYYQPSSQQLSLFWNHTTPLRRLWDTEMGEREKFFCFSYVRKKSERKLSSYFFFFLFSPSFHYISWNWETNLTKPHCATLRRNLSVSSDDRNGDREVSTTGMKFAFGNPLLWVSDNICIFKSDNYVLKQMAYHWLNLRIQLYMHQ